MTESNDHRRPRMVRDFFRRQVREIHADDALRWYGAAVSLLNGITALYWLQTLHIDRVLAETTSPICWPMLDNCYRWRVASGAGVTLLVAGLGVASLVNARLFLEPRRTATAYWLLIFVTAFKLLILFQDFRLALNQHYMATWIACAYLFVSQRRKMIPVLITLFYFWAGTLKLNSEWLSGATLMGRRPFGMPEAWVPWACSYLVVLELVQIWGLLSKRPLVFWLVFAQAILCHISSFWVVGYFYPVLMFLILSLLPMLQFLPRSLPSREWSESGVVLLVGFCALQLFPRLLTSDPALTRIIHEADCVS
jgi:hypothetical protein